MLFFTTKLGSWAETERQLEASRYYLHLFWLPKGSDDPDPPVPVCQFTAFFHSKQLIRYLTLFPHTKINLFFFHYEKNNLLLNNYAQIPEFSGCFIVPSDTCSDISNSDLPLNFSLSESEFKCLSSKACS